MILCLCLSVSVFAQNTEGVVQYEMEVQIKLDLPEEDAEMLGNIPSSTKAQKQLQFSAEASLYEDGVAEADAEPMMWSASSPEGDADVQIKIARPDNKVYKNLEKGTKIESKEFMGKKFLIQDQLDKFDWKLTGEQKEILGYQCQQAVVESEDQNLEAWFTMQIPVSTGPGHYGQLPGLILELVIDEGARTVRATNIELKELDNELKAPTKGKKVNQEEYDTIVKEKLEEMGAEVGSGGAVRVMIRN